MNILISNPSMHPNSLYLPYLWARLKTYIDLDFDKPINNINWLTPITSYETDGALDYPIDILALSCYTWNWYQNLELATAAKKKYPNCKIIAGGPHVDFKDLEIFEKTPFDFICYAEGEQVFAEFVYSVENNLCLDNIPGIISKKNVLDIRPIVPKLNLSVLSSPWIHCQSELKTFSDRVKSQGRRTNVAFETNRGCPYGCTFCDWGSATNSKIKKFNNDMVLEEIEIIMDMKPDFVFITDANYGVYPEDYDFIKKFVECKKKNNYETSVIFSAAKNKKTVLAKCYNELHKENMIRGAQLGIQHTDPEVLQIIKRDNIKMEASLHQMEENWQYGVPLVPGLILGNPGDTIDKWKTCLSDMLKMSFHEDLRIHDFQILPNAPAMEKDYFEKYELGTLRKMYAELPKNRTLVETDFLVESFSYSRTDWIEMQVISYVYQACHILGVTKFMSMLAYHTCNIDYKDFYNYILNLPLIKEILKPVYELLNEYMFGSGLTKFIKYQDKELNIENYIYLKILENRNEFYKQAAIELGEYQDSIIEFQKFIVLNIFDTRDELTLEYDYKSYFVDILGLPAYKKTALLPTKKTTKYTKDFRVGMYSGQIIDSSKLKNVDDLDRKIFSIASNWRHRLFYYRGVIDNEFK